MEYTIAAAQGFLNVLVRGAFIAVKIFSRSPYVHHIFHKFINLYTIKTGLITIKSFIISNLPLIE